jgi:hypothetical protein
MYFTNLVLIFACRYLGCTYENSKEKESFKNWLLVNNFKFYGGWLLASGNQLRRIFSNCIELLILFELFALILVINREKKKSLGHLLFQANELSSEAQRFRRYEKALLCV